MRDRLRAKLLNRYGGKALAPGEEFLANPKFTDALVKAGLVELVERGVPAADVPTTYKRRRHYRTHELEPER